MPKYYKSERTGQLYGYPDDTEDNAAWADIDQLEGAKSPKPTFGEALKDVGVMGARAAYGLSEGVVGLADIFTPGQLGKTLEDAGIAPGAISENLKKSYSPGMQQELQNIEGAIKEGFIPTLKAIPENPQALLEAGVTSLGPMLGGAGIARQLPKAITPLVRGAIGEGAIGAGSASESIRRESPEREITPAQSGVATISGVGTGVFGFVGGKLAAKLGINDIDTLLANGEVQATAKGFVRRLAEGGISEGAFEELPQSMQEQAWQNYATGKPIGEGVGGAGALGMVVGSVMGAGAGGISGDGTPGITDSTSRDLPPIEEAPPSNKTPGLPAAPPPGPAFTDSAIGYEQSRAELAALEAEVDAGLELGKPVPAVAAAPTNPDISPQMQVLNNRILADFGMTPEVRNNPHNFDDPNTSVEPSERRVVRALGISGITNQKWGGTDLSKLDLSNGPVVLQVGEDNHVRPAHYMKGLINDVYRLAQEFNPQGVYVILPQDAGVRGDAKAERGAHFYQDGVHYIIPKHLTNQTKSGSHKSKPRAGNYSPYANLDAYSTMGHEFGHSLIQDFFFQGLAPQERTLLELALEQGQALPELTAKLNPAAQAILTSWQELREGVKSGKVSRTEAAVRLLSPAKLQNKTLMKRMRGLVEYQLEFNEYLAEQVAKAMFTQERMGQSKTLENTFTYNRFEPGTVLGNMEAAIQSWLGPLLETMKQLFGRLSAMEMAGPAASSAEWLKQLQLNAHELVQQRMEGAKAGPVKVAEAPVVEPQNPKQLASTLKSLREAGLVKTNSKQHRELARMLRDGNYEGFLTAIEPLLENKIRFDITDVESADVKGWTPAWLVYHGTTTKWAPTKNNRFGEPRQYAVSSGEGNAAYGWGVLYVAENAEVPKRGGYTKRGAPPSVELFVNKAKYNPSVAERNILETLESDPRIVDKAKELATTSSVGAVYGEYLESWASAIQQALTRELVNAAPSTPKGLLYRAVKSAAEFSGIPKEALGVIKGLFLNRFEIKPYHGSRVKTLQILRPEEEFLNFDLDMSQQSPYVQEILATKLPAEFAWGLKETMLDPDANLTATETMEGFADQAGFYNTHSGLDQILYTQLVSSLEKSLVLGTLQDSISNTIPGNVFAHEALKVLVGNPTIKLMETYSTGEQFYINLVRTFALQGFGYNESQMKASKLLDSLGIAGNIYFDGFSRRQKDGTRNVVIFNPKTVKVVTEKFGHTPARTDTAKVGQNTARASWNKLGTESPTFKAWFTGSQAITYSGKPLLLSFNVGTEFWANGRQFFIGAENPLRVMQIASAATQGSSKQTRIVPGWLSIKNVKRIQEPSYGLTPGFLQKEIQLARDQGNDGLIIYSSTLHDTLWVGLTENTATYDPNYKHVGNMVGAKTRFDSFSEGGEESTTRWELLRDKLHLPHLADSISKFWSLQWSTLQMQQLAHMNPQWHWMHNFSANVQKFYRKVGQMHSRADAVVRQLQWLGKENISKLQKFTLAEYKSGVHWTELRRKDDLGHWEHIPTETTYAKLKEFGIDPDSTSGKRFLRLYIEAKNALQYQMDEQQRVMYELQAKKYSAPGMEANLRQARLETAALYKQLRAAPYWPQHSFGKYRVQVWSSDAVGKVLLYESATDSETEAKVLEQKARAKYPQGVLKSLVLTPDESFLMRLPVEFLDDLQIILGLDSGNPDDMLKLSQIRDSMQSLYSKVPGQTYDPIKRVVEGGSADFVKVFADFSLRNSNFIAKMEYRKNMQTDIAGAESDPANQEFSENKAEIARAIEFMKETVNYMMNPQEELATLRGIVAIGYLWGNVKTAVLNFWGLAHTWAWLNRELGYGKGTITFGKSMWNSTRTQGHEWGSFLGSVMEGAAEGSLLSVTNPNWEMVDGKPTELRQALEQAKQENVLDQSYAYYLATQATRGNLIRMASASLPGKTFKGLVDAGMSLFRGTELLIRRSTFIAAYRTMQQTRPDATPKERYEEVVRLVGLLQGDYTKGNRPELMRGQIKSFITIFMTFVQTASWNAYGGLEKGLRRQEAMEGRASPKFYRNYTAQLVLLYLFMAGLEGLPGMENIMDLLDAMFKKANNGKSAREGLREVLDELNMDPMSVMRGATFNLAGLDLSRSIGLGRIVPGTDVLAEEHGTTKEAIGAGVTAVAGVGGGYIQWLIDTIGATSDAVEAGTDLGVTAERQMARLPGGLGNMFKAAQWAQYDARGPGGGLLAHDEATGMAREIQSWEIAVKALGFQPASISRAQTLKAGQYEARAFWTARKRVLLDAYWQASEIAKDREAIADARRAIAEYNEAVPTKGLKITSTSIKQSIARRNDAVEAAEQYSTMQKSLQELYQQQAESFALDIAE